MKAMTIWQRLDRAILLLIVLLLAGVGLAVWVALACSNAYSRCKDLDIARYNIYYDVMLMGEAIRNLVIEPKNKEAEMNRLVNAQEDLSQSLDSITTQKEFRSFADLQASFAAVREFALGAGTDSLADFQARVLAMADSDPAHAFSPDDVYGAHRAAVRGRARRRGVGAAAHRLHSSACPGSSV